MMKFLQTIRFDPSDTHVFARAAAPGEWAIPGGIAFTGADEGQLKGKDKQAFSNGFLSVSSFGHSTFVSVAEADQTAIDGVVDSLSRGFETNLGAPTQHEARAAARAEVEFVLEMCADVAINSIFTLRRFFSETGEIKEEFRIVDAPGAKPHARVWEVVED